MFGHGWEIAERSRVVMRFVGDALPLYEGAGAAAADGVRTGADERNRAALADQVRVRDGVDIAVEAIAFDPQTSGGLLASVTPDAASRLVRHHGFAHVGEVTQGGGAPSVELV